MMNGYISNFRVVQGQALYTTTFTPPTGPLQPIQGVTQAGLPYGTVLLLRNAPAPGRVLTSKFGGANSGGVLAFPPAAMTSYATALNAGYGQGVYVASASGESGGLAWGAFDKTTGPSTTNFWQSGGSYSASSPYNYTGTVTTVDVTGTSYSGEWLQIQLASSIVLSSYNLASQYNTAVLNPTLWVVLGSRDGFNWSLVNSQNYSGWVAGVYTTFNVSSSQAYNFYRLVIQRDGGYTVAGIGEWTLNGTIESVNVTPDGRLGLGVTNPTQALEVAGSAVVAGTLSAGNPLMFRNALYNGDMRIAQRGVSFVNPSSQYTLDRWFLEGYGAVGNGTVSQIQSGLANFSNAFQLATTSTSLGNWMISQSLETRDIVRFQGQAVTVSFWYRIPTSFTATWAPALYWTASNDTKITNGINGSPNTAGFGNMPNTTVWTYTQFQAFVPSTAQALSIIFSNYNSAINGSTIQITGVQLEKGSVATPYEIRPYATELALCQRYMFQLSTGDTAPCYQRTGSLISFLVRFPVTIRTAVNPTLSGSINVSLGSTDTTQTSISAPGGLSAQTVSGSSYQAPSAQTIGTAGNITVNASSYIRWDAEL
jgi:hypothetical protein